MQSKESKRDDALNDKGRNPKSPLAYMGVRYDPSHFSCQAHSLSWTNLISFVGGNNIREEID